MDISILFLFLIQMDNFVLGFHFYNPNNHELFESSSKNFPKNYVRIRLPRNQNNGVAPLKRRNRSSIGVCKDAGFVCDSPFNKTYTAVFECKTDNQCPGPYKCCDQKCFQHKICVQGTGFSPQTDDGTCEKWPYNCPYPYPYTFSHRFRCDYDKQCPKNYKCCHQNCFVHKICSKRINAENQSPKPVILNPTAKQVEEIRSSPVVKTSSTSTTTSSWFNLFGQKDNEEEEEVESKTEEAPIKEEENENNAEAEEDENQIVTEKVEINEEVTTEVEEINENVSTTTEASIDEETVQPESGTEENNNNEAENYEVTEGTTAPSETVPVTDKVTVVVVVTPDPNSIESILLQNTPTPLKIDPEYEDYYEHYDDNGNDEDENEDEEEDEGEEEES